MKETQTDDKQKEEKVKGQKLNVRGTRKENLLDDSFPTRSLTLDQLELSPLCGLKLAWSFLKSELLLSKLSMVAELVLSSFDVHLGSFVRKQPRIIQSQKVEAWGPPCQPTGCPPQAWTRSQVGATAEHLLVMLWPETQA